MPHFKGKGYGENGEAMEEIVEAAHKYEAKEMLRELMPGGVTVLMQIPSPPPPEPQVSGDDPGDSDD